jgi:hypothetical protein
LRDIEVWERSSGKNGTELDEIENSFQLEGEQS